MRKLMLLLFGVVLGFIAAHFINRTPEGRQFFDRVNRGVDEFGRAFASGYEAEVDDDSLADEVEEALRALPTKP
ncbi:hypothetical protein [Leucobacter luti]|uniref:YtxH-like protein n=1 Tax=Leucobacter luti TaxID=340320 RepID=A0A4Q7TV77_9MICO|nr:hypothetical protein [Leucobacter luti]MBL3698080.1 hypothetical protein [Leucobacter luti]RZT64836.1 hypothetical protein EV139_2260 [Leucobacter luti]